MPCKIATTASMEIKFTALSTEAFSPYLHCSMEKQLAILARMETDSQSIFTPLLA